MAPKQFLASNSSGGKDRREGWVVEEESEGEEEARLGDASRWPFDHPSYSSSNSDDQIPYSSCTDLPAGEMLDPLLTSYNGPGDSPAARFVLFPIRYPRLWAAYKHAQSLFWTASSLTLSSPADWGDWNGLGVDERACVGRVVLTGGMLGEGGAGRLVEKLSGQCRSAEGRCYFGWWSMTENMHSEVYAQLIDTYLPSIPSCAEVYNSLQTTPSSRREADWVQRWVSDQTSTFGERLVALAASEAVFSSGSVILASWLKSRGLMPGLTKALNLIARNRHQHASFALLLLQHLLPTSLPSPQRLRSVVRSAVEVEKEFLSEIVGMGELHGREWVEWKGDGVLEALGVGRAKTYSDPHVFEVDVSDYFHPSRPFKRSERLDERNVKEDPHWPRDDESTPATGRRVRIGWREHVFTTEEEF